VEDGVRDLAKWIESNAGLFDRLPDLNGALLATSEALSARARV
jgi:hypothetical protein